jgi:hypothetical protein
VLNVSHQVLKSSGRPFLFKLAFSYSWMIFWIAMFML